MKAPIHSGSPVNVLLTPGGGPGILAQVAALKSSRRFSGRAILADANPASGNLFLPEVDAAYQLPSCSSEAYMPALLRLIRRERIDVMYSGLDEELPVLAQNRQRLSDAGCRLLLPPLEALRVAQDKERAARAFEGRLRAPRTWALEEVSDPDDLWSSLGGRMVIKISTSRGGRHVYLPDDYEEYVFLLRKMRRLADAKKHKFIVQQRIVGTEYNVSSLHADQSTMIYAVSRRKFDPRPVKSTTTAAVIERNDAVIAAALDAVNALGLYPGFNNTELIVSDDDGLPYVLEVNAGRTAAQDMNLVAAGINLTDLLIDLVYGRAVAPIPHPRDGTATLKIRRDVVVEHDDILRRVPAP